MRDARRDLIFVWFSAAYSLSSFLIAKDSLPRCTHLPEQITPAFTSLSSNGNFRSGQGRRKSAGRNQQAYGCLLAARR